MFFNTLFKVLRAWSTFINIVSLWHSSAFEFILDSDEVPLDQHLPSSPLLLPHYVLVANSTATLHMHMCKIWHFLNDIFKNIFPCKDSLEIIHLNYFCSKLKSKICIQCREFIVDIHRQFLFQYNIHRMVIKFFSQWNINTGINVLPPVVLILFSGNMSFTGFHGHHLSQPASQMHLFWCMSQQFVYLIFHCLSMSWHQYPFSQWHFGSFSGFWYEKQCLPHPLCLRISSGGTPRN